MRKEVLTLTEAAKLLRVTPKALTAELERGTVPGRRINGDWRFRRAALLDWLGERETTERPLMKFAGI
jgi:excisionase family DNA binding protein